MGGTEPDGVASDEPSGDPTTDMAETDADRNEALDGTFTLTTDAEIGMHNEEGGAQPGPGGMKTLTWRVTPLTRDAPTASLRLAK